MPNFSELKLLLDKYFPDHFSMEQVGTLEKAFLGYLEWNQKINVISRKDIENLAIRHFLHSFAIAKVIDFLPDSKVLDAGTGGGFPGIPLAIIFPETEFHLVDSRSKKITVVQEIVQLCGLSNVHFKVQRIEQLKGQHDFVVSRAVTTLDKFVPWVIKRVHPRSKHSLDNGILYLKGGDVEAEILELKLRGVRWKNFPISNFFEEEFFTGKHIVHLAWTPQTSTFR